MFIKTYKNAAGILAYQSQGEEKLIQNVIAYNASSLNQRNLDQLITAPKLKQQSLTIAAN